jgi:alpha-tubulin suppressor-like RCC1 family protein/uncharacterized protein YkwD
VAVCEGAKILAKDQSQDAFEAAVLCLVNELRQLENSAPLTPNKKLRDAARAHAQAAISLRWWPATGGPVTHVNPDTGSTPQIRIKEQDYCPDDATVAMNENTYNWWYKGQPDQQFSPYAVVVGYNSQTFSWKNSAGHYATMIDPQYTEGGVGLVHGVPLKEPILDDDGNTIQPDGGITVVMTFGGCRQPELQGVGQPLAWGWNQSGQVGDGTTTDQHKPVPVANPLDGPPLENVTAVSAGAYHSLALNPDGTVWAWGQNDRGQLGDASTTPHPRPNQVIGLKGAFAIAAGDRHNLALASASTVWAWGHNEYGQLGIGTFADQFLPIKVSGLPSTFFAAVAAGWGHSLALNGSGVVYAWGANTSGQVGNVDIGNLFSLVPQPVPVNNLDGVSRIAAGHSSSFALKSDGNVWAWGANAYGELGTGDTTMRTSPVRIVGLTDVTQIAAGAGHSLALRQDGSVWAWGYNQWGQLGDGTTINRLMPTKVPSLSSVVKIASGSFHCLALKADGTVWAWGANIQGQLGIGTTKDGHTPMQVSGPPMRGIAGGHHHSLGMRPLE